MNQHHVWQHHLRAWANRKGQIWCLQQGKPGAFLANTSNVASQRFFYQFHELSEADLSYLESLISAATDQSLQKMNREWVSTLQLTFTIRKQLANLAIPQDAREEYERELRTVERTLGESYHSSMEDIGKPILEKLRSGDAAFFDDDGQEAMDWIQFMSFQIFRTSKLRNAMKNLPFETPHDPSKTGPIEQFIYATNIGTYLFLQRKNYRIVFLRNETGCPFITGDQPIANMLGLNDEQERLEFYYPLNPTLAILFTPRGELFPAREKLAELSEVEAYNLKIYEISSTQIFGNDRDYLRSFSTVPKTDWNSST